MCGRAIPDMGWCYMWKGKQGTACDDCGRDFHAIGYYLLEKAKRMAEEMGIEVAQTKEKFGRMVMYTNYDVEGTRIQHETDILSIRQHFQHHYPDL